MPARVPKSHPTPRRCARSAAVLVIGLIAATGCAPTSGSGDGSGAEADQASEGTAAPSDPGSGQSGSPTPGSTSPVTEPRPIDPIKAQEVFAEADSAMRKRVDNAGIGGMLLVVRDGQVAFERSYGNVGPDTPLWVASTAKWMTSAAILTLVDEGRLDLDAPIAEVLPEFDGSAGSATLRQLLSHTSGIKQRNCIFNPSDVLSRCVSELAANPVEFEPGSAFSYGNASYHVAARMAEVVTGQNFQTFFDERIAQPLEMTNTSWGTGTTQNPTPASSARTTVHDSARFLEMMLDGGVIDGERILSETLVAEFARNQVAGYETWHDYSVNITQIPTYGFGTWRDVPDGDSAVHVMSGNGAGGFYPWIDLDNHAYGIVAVEDRRGAEIAVPASKVVMDLAVEATARL